MIFERDYLYISISRNKRQLILIQLQIYKV